MKKLDINTMELTLAGGPPFFGLINPGCGPIFPNVNGFLNGNAPLIINGGFSNGAACPLPFVFPPN